jgi:hypothetical protein
VLACQSVPRQSALLASTQLEISGGELRARTYASGRLLALRIEEVADSVLTVTRDPDTRRNALLWKTSAIPSLQEATLAPDPLIAAMDLYAYSVQTQEYFERGDGVHMFGTEQPIVLAVIPKLVVGTRDFAQAVVGERRVDLAVADVDRWARAHPARGKHFLRESLVGAWAEAFGSKGSSAFATLGRVDQSVEEIAERLQFINESMLKQVRWNAELVASGLARPEDLEAARTLLARTNDLIARLPNFMSAERAAVLEAVSAERIAALRDIDRQREATIGALQGERAIILDAMRAERIAAIAALDSIVRRSMHDSAGLIDHVFARLAQVLGATLLFVGVAGFLAMQWWVSLNRPRPRQPSAGIVHDTWWRHR